MRFALSAVVGVRLVALVVGLLCAAARGGMVTTTLNGLEIGIDEATGGIVKLAYEPVGVILDCPAESAGLLDVAIPVKEFVPLRMATRFSKAAIQRKDDGITIRWSPLGRSRPKVAVPGGEVAAEVTIRPAPDGRSVVLKCRLENHSGAMVGQVLFPDLRGLKATDTPRTTMLRFAGGYPVYPFNDPPVPPMSAQYYVNSNWREYPPSTGTYGANMLRWLDLSSYKGGISVFERAWGTGERPTVRTCRSQADLERLRIVWDYKSGVKPGQTWESDEVWLTPHWGGWAKGIETFREYVKTKHPQRRPPARIRDGLGMQTIFMIQAPETDPDYAAFKFKDIPRVAADAKTHGITELNVWGWCMYFALPFDVRPELGTPEEFVQAVKEAKAMGVNVSPFVSCNLLQSRFAQRYGGSEGSPAWAYHPDMVPLMDPYYLDAAHPLQFWKTFNIDARNKNYQADVPAAFKAWIDKGVTSWSWDQVFGDAPGNGGMTDLLFKVRELMREKDPEAVFSGEQVSSLEFDHGLLDYTWNWQDYADNGPVTNLMATPRLNCNIEDSPQVVKAAFMSNLWLNVMPRKPDQPNGTALIGEKPAMAAAVKQVAALRKQFLPYFVEGTFIGDSVLAGPIGGYAQAYQMPDKLLIIVMNNQPQPQAITMTSDLSLWLPKASKYTVNWFDGQGKAVKSESTTDSHLKLTTGVMASLDLVLIVVAAEK